MRIFVRRNYIVSVWSALCVVSCAPADLNQPIANNEGIFVRNYDSLDQITIGSRIRFEGYFQEGHEVAGIYLNRREYENITTQCISVSDLPRYRNYMDGRRYSVSGTLVENPCTVGGHICRNACGTYRINVDRVAPSN